ncbi:MAG: NAD(P)H-hydrate epimerase, partial [Akkermansiaceae bacterium]
MRELEEQAFKQGATPESLMEKAGRGIAQAILRRYSKCGTVIACIGSGNNGGDALVAARYLAEAGWKVGIRCLHESSELGALPRKKLRELGDCPMNAGPEREAEHPLVLLDGLLGIGAKGPLRAPLDELASWMNQTRLSHKAQTIAMDIPSGVDGDSGEVYDGAVVADLTLTIGVPKPGLFAASVVNYTGAIELVPLDELPVPSDGDLCLNDVHYLRGILPRRDHDCHKGDAGRVGILAGSRGMLGAAVLCATGALRAGAGLVTLFADESIYPLLAPMLPAEVMLRPISMLSEINPAEFDAFAVGPGMGQGDTESNEAYLSLLQRMAIPIVIDADGLNRIADLGVEQCIGPNLILTPHPGELARLFPEWAGVDRIDVAKAFRKRYDRSTLLLKGAHTLVARSGSPVYFNATGN